MPPLKNIIKAILFSSETPVSLNRLCTILTEFDRKDISDALTELVDAYRQSSNTIFEIVEIAGGYQFLSKPEYAEYISRLRKDTNKVKLSSAAIETLSIIAYKQPVIRADIEDIRGVQVGGIVRNLCELGFVKLVGRSDLPGKPLLYGTTKKFLEHFGLNSLKDLPKIEKFANNFD